MTKTKRNNGVAYAAKHDESACRAVMLAVLAALGSGDEVLQAQRVGEPHIVYRQIAKLVALEHGFAPRCIATVANCYSTTVSYAKGSLAKRLKKDPSLAATLATAREAAAMVTRKEAA